MLSEAKLFVNYIIKSDFKYNFLSEQSFEVMSRMVNDGFYNNIKEFNDPSLGPDVIVELRTKTVLMDHFEFDSSGLKKQSSKFRRESADVERMIKEKADLNPEEVVIVSRELETDSSTSNYINNLMRNLRKHMSKKDLYITNYKDRVIKEHDLDIEIGFIIENSSALPT